MFSSPRQHAALFHEGALSSPAPILRAYPGDTVQVNVRSELPDNVKSGRDDATGMSLHGLRLATATHKGGLQSRLAGPQLAIHTFTLSEDHAPGLHWYRVGGELGFMGAFYVLPPKKSASSASSSSTQAPRLLLFQFQEEDHSYWTNGDRTSTPLELRVGEGQVLDLAHASGPHLLEIEPGPGCAMKVLALDGVDVDESRDVPYVGLVPRQRARVLLSCHEAGTSALVARAGATPLSLAAASERNADVPVSQKWEQRLLTVSVVKSQAFSRLPRLPSVQAPAHRQDTPAGGAGGYLRDLVAGPKEGLALSSCSVTLFPCPRQTSCPAGREICPLSTPAAASKDKDQDRTLEVQHSALREMYITISHPAPAASVRLSPAQPFQVLEFTPADKHAPANPYLTHWGRYGEWRDVLPPLQGTFRVRYLAEPDTRQEDPVVEYDAFDVVGYDKAVEEEAIKTAGLALPAFGPVKRKSMWSFSGKRSGEVDAATLPAAEVKDAYLLVQAMIGEEKQDPEWVEASIKGLVDEYLVEEQEPEPAADDDTIEVHPATLDEEEKTRRGLVAIPVQMPRRYLPGAASKCNESASVWPTAFTLHVKNTSSIYLVVSKLHALLAEGGSADMPQLCSVNVTLLSSGTATAAAAAAAAKQDGHGGLLQDKVPSRVVLLLAFAGGACVLLVGFLVYRQLLAPAGPPRSSRRSSVHHDPTTIETQITELDDSATHLGIKGSALRHNSRSRNNSLTGLSAGAFPSPRLATGVSVGAGLGGSLSGSHPQQHNRSSSSLPADLAAMGHSRSASMPHNSGFGFFFPRHRQSTESINISNSGAGATVNSTSGGAGKNGENK